MLVTLEEVAAQPCLVLLGEPGIGKSTELQRALAKAWGKDAVQYLQLAPLRESDVRVAAETDGILDVDEFMSQVAARDVGALAARPVTLRLLLRTYAKSGSFPHSRPELYD